MVEYIYLIIGFLGLVFGAEILIRGSINLAHAFKIPPFIVGVVIVAGGTSIPELAASLQAINLGVKDIVIGNVIGSNIANILLIIGAVSLIHPIVEIKTSTDSSFSLVHKAGYIVSKNISDFVAIISSIIFIYFCVKGVITYLEGLLMLVCLVVFLVSLLMKEKADFHEVPEKLIPLWLSSFFIVVGLFAVIFGSGFSRLGTPMMITDFLLGLEVNKYFILFIIMAMIFVLGWPLEWVPIVLIIIPIILPLVEGLGFNLIWFAILVAVNLQTAWLSPPVALSAYFLKGVVPEWDLKDIYIGMMQFMVLQLIGLILIVIFPQIALWLPHYIYGS